jgi:hypothetical protein
VPGGHKRLERARGERRSACEDDAQGRAGGVQAALRWRFFSLVRTRFCFISDR